MTIEPAFRSRAPRSTGGVGRERQRPAPNRAAIETRVREEGMASHSIDMDLVPDGSTAPGSNVLLDPEETSRWEQLRPRTIEPGQWSTYERYMAEIFTSFGMELGTPGTKNTPQRFLRALFDSTAGYEGDANLLTAFPTECRGGPDCRISQVVEGPISFFALCEHHALPFYGHATLDTSPTRTSSESRS